LNPGLFQLKAGTPLTLQNNASTFAEHVSSCAILSAKSTEPAIPIEGKIVSILPGTMFRVELDNNQVVLGCFNPPRE
jgi:hypothetical protein